MAPLYLLAPGVMTVVAVVGGATAVFAAVVALTQFDVKRTLAYSTISQLGFMVLACGLGAYGAAILHLLTHGAMKSFLFLSAGSALEAEEGHHHSEHHAPSGQPVSWSLVKAGACALALALLPPLVIFSGPYEQLWTLSNAAQARAGFLVLGLGTVFLVGYYLCQGLVSAFAPTDVKPGQRGTRGPPLLAPSLVVGFVPLAAGVAAALVLSARGLVDFLAPALPNAASAGGFDSVAAGGMSGLLAGGVAAVGGWGVALLRHRHPLHVSGRWLERRKSLYVFFLNKGYFDEIYAAFIIQPVQCFARWLWRRVDGRLIDLPANQVVHAVERVGTRLSVQLGGEQVLKPEVPFAAMRLLVVLLVSLLFVLGVAERIEIYFLE
jgi:NADH-quinone oxidoreductase subunit L